MTWAEYDDGADRVSGELAAAGIERGDRVAVVMPDGPGVHAVFVGAERLGAVVVGIGFRAGSQEIEHLVTTTGASLLVTEEGYLCAPATGLARMPTLVIPPDLGALARSSPSTTGALGPDDLFLLNSTSGTTGLPKCVMHTQNRWFAFHRLAVEAGRADRRRRVLLRHPDAVRVRPVDRPLHPGDTGLPDSGHRPVRRRHDTRPDRTPAGDGPGLRQHAVHHDAQRAAGATPGPARRCGACSPAVKRSPTSGRPNSRSAPVPWSCSSTAPTRPERCRGPRSSTRRERRLRTAGRVIDEMHVRLFDDRRDRHHRAGRPGIPGCKGPATCIGYYDDEVANAALVTARRVDADG